MEKQKIKLSVAEAKKLLKNYLPDFLKRHGIRRKGEKMFQCIYPDHEDSNPSMHIYRSFNDELMYACMGCGRTGDIFVANHILTGAPLSGYDFILKNLQPLAEMYGFEVDIRPLTAEELEKLNIRSVNAVVKDIIIGELRKNFHTVNQAVKEYIDSHGLKEELFIDFSVGYCSDYRNLVSQLKATGFDDEIIAKAGITSTIFNENNLIFAIIDENGNVNGFAARNCAFDKENGIGSKYVNTQSNAVFRMRGTLYNINRALRKQSKIKSLYITEGQTDAIALDKAGYRAIAICGSTFSEEHIMALQRLGENDIVFVLDGDKAGEAATIKAITSILEGINNFRSRVVWLPEGEDPNSYIVKYGPEAFLRLRHVTTFTWKLDYLKQSGQFNDYEIAEMMVKLVANESSEIQKEQKLNELSEVCGVNINALRSELSKLINHREKAIKTERANIVRSAIAALEKDPDNALLIFQESQNAIREIMARYNNDLYGFSHTLNVIDDFVLRSDTYSQENFLYFGGMPIFEKKHLGPMNKKLFILGGEPNAGKSSFMINLAISILNAHEDFPHWDQIGSPERYNDVCIFFHTIDDSFDEIFPRFVSALAAFEHPYININRVAAPDMYGMKSDEAFMYVRNMAIQKVKDWVQRGRLIIKDSTVGSTIQTAYNVITNIQEQYPGRRVLYFLDNMYKLTDFESSDEIVKLTKLARTLKQDISVDLNVTTFATIEYRKGELGTQRSNSRQKLNEMIKYSKSLEYDANWIGHLLNEMHTNPDTTALYYWDPQVPINERTEENKLPIVKLAVTKNKISKFKNDIFYYFYPEKALFMELTAKDVAASEGPTREILSRYFNLEGVEPESILDKIPKPSFYKQVLDVVYG